jgi:hypothetical protein
MVFGMDRILPLASRPWQPRSVGAQARQRRERKELRMAKFMFKVPANIPHWDLENDCPTKDGKVHEFAKWARLNVLTDKRFSSVEDGPEMQDTIREELRGKEEGDDVVLDGASYNKFLECAKLPQYSNGSVGYGPFAFLFIRFIEAIAKAEKLKAEDVKKRELKSVDKPKELAAPADEKTPAAG